MMIHEWNQSVQADDSQLRVLVVGGAGFIGSHLVDVLLSSQCAICVYDDLSCGRRTHLPKEGNSFRFVQGNILDIELLQQVVVWWDPQVIYHLAAIHHIPTCEAEPERALRINVEGTQCVLRASQDSSRLERLVFTSSGAIYDDSETPLDEGSPIRPRDIYGVCKVASEYLVTLGATQMGVPITIARLFNTVGPRETNSHLIPEIIEQIARGQREITLGNLEPRRDYVHVRDVAEALYALVRFDQRTDCEVFNIGSGQEYSVKEVIEMCAEVLGDPLHIVQSASKIRQVDRLNQLAGLQKIKREVGWQPVRSLRQALQELLLEVHVEKNNGIKLGRIS